MSIYVCVRFSGPVQCTITLPLLNVRLTERRPDSLLDALGIGDLPGQVKIVFSGMRQPQKLLENCLPPHYLKHSCCLKGTLTSQRPLRTWTWITCGSAKLKANGIHCAAVAVQPQRQLCRAKVNVVGHCSVSWTPVCSRRSGHEQSPLLTLGPATSKTIQAD